MAVRCSQLTAPDSNAEIVMTLTSVKTASRHANTTPGILLEESTSLVAHTLTMWYFFECACVRMCSPSLILGQSPAFCGRSGKQLKKHHSSQRGMLIDDWSRAVKTLNVSSSVNQASRLIDCSDQCWQSSGSQGKVGDGIVYFNITGCLFFLREKCYFCSTGFVSSFSQMFLCTG